MIRAFTHGIAAAVTLLSAPALMAQDFTVNLVNEPSTLDPHQQWNPDSYYVYRNIFDNIVTRDNAGKIIPQIATDWKQVSDTEMVLTIRDDVVFHDGEPLTAEDVAFSIQRITNPEFGSPQLGQFNQIIGAEPTGEYEVTLTTKGAYPVLLAQLVKLSVVPKHVVEAVGNEAFNAAPVGSGPFTFEGWKRGVDVTLSRNENYWGDTGPFETVSFVAVPDASTRVANLSAGTADLIVSIDSDFARQLETQSGIQVLTAPTERVAFMGMNTIRAPFDDPEVRKAATMAIDREGIVQGILAGGETVVHQMATPSHYGYVADAAAIPYDPEEAKRIVAETGAGNTPMQFATSPVYDQRIVQAIQQMLTEAGFDVEISMTDMSTYLQAARAPEQSERPYLSFGRWSCACQDVDGVQFPLLHSSSSWSRVNDADLDSLLEKGRTALDDETRMEAYSNVQQIVHDNAYILPLYQAVALYGASENLEWTPTANESLFLNRMNWSE
ncbi:ABC transporter substrate-binding protein [Phaeobacter sp. B1627]|uniref:ABC transporter substrate-binding protein n=1 Tax=Phaeobacter sp. B1627 TaxID=2583809 RepID=UPI001118D8F4|nr:ABC transporter substrate-binding protein [Phaeobacter sp. B1627]TNJ48056.1 peptide ABC transporter [Phaeobacter sp. B1627]